MQDEDGAPAKDYVNIPGLMGLLISKRLATLHELQTVYCLEDAYYMYEAYMVPKYNEWCKIQTAKRRTAK